MVLEFTPAGVTFAYTKGIFPMPDPDTNEIGWYRPDPRAIIPLDGFHISRSLARTLRRGRFEARVNTCFDEVMRACGERAEGTWITDEFIDVYGSLHRAGLAHSVEVYLDGVLAGGTYGVALGGAFMAESMFHRETDASKVALAHLVERLNACGFTLLDVQFLTPHLASLGAIETSHRSYLRRLDAALRLRPRFM